MRTSILPVVLLAAASQAATYTNSFGSSDPALQFITDGPTGLAWDTAGSYASFKPWDVVTSDGSVAVSGFVSLPQSYIDSNPSAAGGGAASFSATTTFDGLSSFKVSDLTEISFQVSIGVQHSAPTHLGLALVTADGTYYYLGGKSTMTGTRTNGGTGDYVYTFTNFSADPDDRVYTSLNFRSLATYAPAQGGGYSLVKGQFLDMTLQSTYINASPAVPEASTYGLMLGGLALAGAVIRRRKTSK